MLHAPLLLLLDPHGLEAWQRAAGRLERRAGFGHDEHEAFARWLATQPGRHVCRLLVNLPDESFEHEDLPPARGRDRAALIARRRAAWFPHTPFVRAWPAHAARSARKGPQRIIFAGLERPEALLAWLEALSRAQGRLTHLIPAASLIPTLQPHETATGDDALIIGGFTRAGLRLSLVGTHALLFSRLITHCTAPAGGGSPLPEESIQGEVQRTHAYLVAQRLLRADAPLRLCMLPADAERSSAAAPGAPAAAPADTSLALEPMSPPEGRSPATSGASSMATADSAMTPPPPLEALDRRLLAALARARPSQGWPIPTAGTATRVQSTRALMFGSLLAAGVGGGGWYVHDASSPAAAIHPVPLIAPAPPAAEAPEPPTPAAPHVDARPSPLPPADPDPVVGPDTALPDSPASAAAPAEARPSRRIQGIVHVHGGKTRVWLDGELVEARSAGLRLRADGLLSPAGRPEIRLRVGDLWPPAAPPAEPGTHTRAPAEEPLR